ALMSTEAHDIEAEDSALAVLRFASGAVGTVVTSTAVYPGFAQRLEVSGTDGTVVIEDGEIIRCELIGDHADPGAHGSLTPRGAAQSVAAAKPVDLHAASHAAQISDFLHAIDEDRPPAVTGADGRAAVEVACAVYESARAGRAVRLPAAHAVPDVAPRS